MLYTCFCCSSNSQKCVTQTRRLTLSNLAALADGSPASVLTGITTNMYYIIVLIKIVVLSTVCVLYYNL